MQDFSGSVVAHGPYRTERARDNRYEKVSGGEVHKFNSLSSEPEEAIQEYRDEQIRRS